MNLNTKINRQKQIDRYILREKRDRDRERKRERKNILYYTYIFLCNTFYIVFISLFLSLKEYIY